MHTYAQNFNSTMKEVSRSEYITRLEAKRGNRMIKVITGLRRCGKSYLLFTLFHRHLMANGVDEKHIITLALDDFDNRRYLDPEVLYRFVTERIKDRQTSLRRNATSMADREFGRARTISERLIRESVFF